MGLSALTEVKRRELPVERFPRLDCLVARSRRVVSGIYSCGLYVVRKCWLWRYMYATGPSVADVCAALTVRYRRMQIIRHAPGLGCLLATLASLCPY